ncbi:hypothetical protein MKW92_023373 [Papaver armeniacum]|nr:hypothetical protein MKW92_023373 [Papaver armeniacum]
MKTSRFNHLFATLVCICAFTEMASAWQTVCAPGIDYIERNYHPIPGDKCGSCPTWCNSECSSIGLFMVQNDCRIVGADMDCQCCCGKVAPTGPPPPPSAPPFSEETGVPHIVCAADQKSLLIPREQARDCPWNPQCEAKCKDEGRSSARSECWGSSRDFVAGVFTWYELCCCGDVLPPPCCGCCSKDINIQISVKSGGDVKVSTPTSSLPGLSL